MNDNSEGVYEGLNTSIKPPFYLRPVGWVAGFLALILIILVISFFSNLSSTQSDMTTKEAKLSAKYQDNQNVLSNYKASIKEALGVAQQSTAAQDKVLTDVIAGRGSTGKGGSAFSAIVEAYPDVKLVGQTFQNVQSAIFAGREAFKNQQTALLDLLRDYDAWRNRAGFLYGHKIIISLIGAPSDNLEARIGTDVVRGKAALDRMKLIVLTGDTKKAFESGEDEPLDLSPSTPAPTK